MTLLGAGAVGGVGDAGRRAFLVLMAVNAWPRAGGETQDTVVEPGRSLHHVRRSSFRFSRAT